MIAGITLYHDEQEDPSGSESDTMVSGMSSMAVGVSKCNKYRMVKKSSTWLKNSRYQWLKVETGPDQILWLDCFVHKKHSKLPRNGTATTWVTVPC